MCEKNKKESLSDNLAMTVAISNLELPAEIVEFTIDQIIDDGILKDIPIVGWIAKGLSVSRSISDRILFHKIIRFLVALDENNEGSRENFCKRINDDPAFKKRVGEHLLILLNKIDTIDKASFLAKCFAYFLTNVIDHDYFIDLSSVIERSTIADLKSLCVPCNKRVVFRNISFAASSGLLVYGISTSDDNEPEIGFKMSDQGSDLRDIFMGNVPYNYAQKKERENRHEELLMELEKRRATSAENGSQGSE